MNPFEYSRAPDASAALSLWSPNAKFLAGGTNLLDLMREDVEQPSLLIDITRTPLAEIQPLPNRGLRIGAGVRNSHLASDPRIREHFPLLSHAVLNGASAQLRNMATTGGNLMQRTRCFYFYDTASHCNKREPGTGCDAMEGFNRYHAILGISPQCIAAHPSDMCVALAALDATVNVSGKRGDRSIPMLEFHRLPGDTPNIDTNLEPGELITSVDLPASSAGLPSSYRKVRDRASYAFALVAVAAAMRIDGGRITDVRIALGGVAHKPWRAVTAERSLRASAPSIAGFEAAASAELEPAIPRRDNIFKIELAKRTIVTVLSELAAAQGESL